MTTVDTASRIAKIAVGNPETARVAFDFIPDYIPRLTSRASWRDDELLIDGHQVKLSEEEREMLRHFGPDRSVYQVCQAWARTRELSDSDVLTDGFAILKELRECGLVIRDNDLGTQSLLIKIRDYRRDPVGRGEINIVYLPALARRVLTLSSGSFSCREIWQRLRAEYPTAEVGLPFVETTTQMLVDLGVVTWLSSEAEREEKMQRRIE